MSKHIAKPVEWGTETAANARLIAAAPDLLAACKAAKEMLSDTNEYARGYTNAMQLISQFSAAIAKAEGGDNT